MKEDVIHTILRRLAGVGSVLLLILIGGSIGYYFIGQRLYSLLDCLYMTVITISTIGYGEIIDLSASPGGRIFTILVALAGIGTLTYTFSMITALIVEGNLTDSFRRKKMEKKIKTLSKHQIVCSAERVGIHIVNELAATERPFVVIENHQEHIDALLERFPEALYVTGDPTDNEVLLQAGIERAEGLFATEDDDNRNLVICLSAQHLKPGLRVIAHAREPKNIDKMKRAGATSVISSEQIGGLRMASEMTRPAVVSFLDVMLRDKDKNLRVEEISIPAALAGKTILDLKLKRFRDLLLMALKEGGEWIYNPPDEQPLTGQSVLIFMGTPEARIKLERELKGVEG
jgi:voltage-gated potassium channel